MKIIKSKRGYFYKVYKNGKKKRISKDNYNKLKSKNKQIKHKMKSKVLKGGNKMIHINILHNEIVEKYNSVNLEYLVSFFKELEDYNDILEEYPIINNPKLRLDYSKHFVIFLKYNSNYENAKYTELISIYMFFLDILYLRNIFIQDYFLKYQYAEELFSEPFNKTRRELSRLRELFRIYRESDYTKINIPFILSNSNSTQKQIAILLQSSFVDDILIDEKTIKFFNIFNIDLEGTVRVTRNHKNRYVTNYELLFQFEFKNISFTCIVVPDIKDDGRAYSESNFKKLEQLTNGCDLIYLFHVTGMKLGLNKKYECGDLNFCYSHILRLNKKCIPDIDTIALISSKRYYLQDPYKKFRLNDTFIFNNGTLINKTSNEFNLFKNQYNSFIVKNGFSSAAKSVKQIKKNKLDSTIGTKFKIVQPYLESYNMSKKTNDYDGEYKCFMININDKWYLFHIDCILSNHRQIAYYDFLKNESSNRIHQYYIRNTIPEVIAKCNEICTNIPSYLTRIRLDIVVIRQQNETNKLFLGEAELFSGFSNLKKNSFKNDYTTMFFTTLSILTTLDISKVPEPRFVHDSNLKNNSLEQLSILIKQGDSDSMSSNTSNRFSAPPIFINNS